MSRTTANFSEDLNPPWTEMEPIRFGRIPPGLGTPLAYVTVEREGKPWRRIDLYGWPDESYPSQQVTIWEQILVIGFGNHVYFVHTGVSGTLDIDLGTYFGHIYPSRAALLVTSGDKMYRFSGDGLLKWTTAELGIDGVVVKRVENGTIYGEGEWDTPGDVRPFRVDLKSGRILYIAPRRQQWWRRLIGLGALT